MNITHYLSLVKQMVKGYDLPLAEVVNEEFNDKLKLLISIVLSARTRDEVTAKACKRLFSHDIKKLSVKEVEELIYPVGFYKNKARYIKELANLVSVPETIDELIKLPGVGRKTANLMLSVGFNKPAICVDTHVHRIINRWGYVKTGSPLETEMALRSKLPLKHWIEINKLLVLFGQHVCTPLRPRCNDCLISDCLFKRQMSQNH